MWPLFRWTDTPSIRMDQSVITPDRMARSSRPSKFAIAVVWQGRGLGSGLLKDAMLRTLQAADIAGIRAFAVHAKDDPARAFYEHFGFSELPSDPYHLFRLLKDIRASLR